MQSTEKRSNRVWLSILSAGVVIALVLGVVGLVRFGEAEKETLPSLEAQLNGVESSLSQLETAHGELKIYAEALQETVKTLQTDLVASVAAAEALRSEIYGRIDAEKAAALAQLKADKADLEAKIAAANKAVEDAKAANVASEKAISDQIAALEAALKKTDVDNKKALEDSIAALETALAKADADNKKALEDSIAALKAQVESGNANLTTAIQTLNTNLSALIKANADNIAALQTTATDLQKQIADTNTKIDDIKTELDGKISASEKKVLDELNTLKITIEGQLTAIGTSLEALAKNDEQLGKHIADLKAYVDAGLQGNRDWANATFSTLEQYEATQTTISEIKALIKDNQDSITALETKLNKKITDDIAAAVAGVNADIAAKAKEITDGYTAAITEASDAITAAYTDAIKNAVTKSEASMKEWVNGVLAEGYYTKAEIDGKITALQTQVTEGDAALQKEIDDLETALAKAEADLTAAYEKAINDAITNNNGKINAEIAAAVKTAQDNLQAQIDVINNQLTDLDSRVDSLEKNFANRIQSLTFVPQYSDGKILMDYASRTTQAHFRISPASMAKLIEVGNVTAYARYTNDPTGRSGSRAYEPEFPLTVDSVTGDETGMLEVNLKEDSENLFDNDFWTGAHEAVIYIVITDDNGNKIASDTVPMIAHAYGSFEGLRIYEFGDGNTYTGEVTE